MCVPEFRNYLELSGITWNYPELGVPRETTLYGLYSKMPMQKLGFLMTEAPGTMSAGTHIRTLYYSPEVLTKGIGP